MSPEDMQRFEVEAQSFMGELGLTLHCKRCGAFTAVLDDFVSLAELVQRAGEHTEVCR